MSGRPGPFLPAAVLVLSGQAAAARGQDRGGRRPAARVRRSTTWRAPVISVRADRGSIPRADVAEVIAVALETPSTVRTTFEVVGGEVPVAEALAALTPGPLAG